MSSLEQKGWDWPLIIEKAYIDYIRYYTLYILAIIYYPIIFMSIIVIFVFNDLTFHLKGILPMVIFSCVVF